MVKMLHLMPLNKERDLNLATSPVFLRFQTKEVIHSLGD